MNITLKRWLDIVVYGFLIALVINVLTKINWEENTIKFWQGIFDSFGIYQQRFLLLVFGGLIYLFLVKMNAYSKKASFRNFIFYPSITMVVLPATLFLIWLSDILTLKNVATFIFNEQIITLSYLVASLFIMNIYHICCSFKKEILPEEAHQIEVTSESTYEEYKEWFEDDTPISNIQQLSVDLQSYAKRITTLIVNKANEDKSVHLSLCGGFGSGKSSIIKCVTNELDSSFIHSNIDTWGADTKSISAFVLAKVVDDIADYVDMSAFKSLPSQYIEALKLGNNTSKLLAIFSTVSSNPEKGLKKLNGLLGAIKKKLLITIQDVDRCQEPQKTTEELAALLDKLKELNNISFIIALGYESSVSETIKKVCDYREDLIQPDNHFIFLNFINELNQKAADTEGDVVISDISQIKLNLNIHKTNYINPYNFSSSQRSFKHICRRIDAIWQTGTLMGEIDLECLCLLVVLREELPAVFEVLAKQKNTLIEKIESYIKNKNKDKAKGDKDTGEAKNKESILFEELSSYFPFVNAKYVVNLEEIISYLHYLFKCGSGFNNLHQSMTLNQKKNEYNDYFKRFMLEKVPSDELADQVALRLFKNIDQKGEVESLIENFQNDEKGNHWIKAYSRFSYEYLTTKNVGIYFKIYTAMVDYYYQDSRIHINPYDRKISVGNNVKFLNSLIEKCCADEEYIASTFEMSLIFPLFTNQNHQLMQYFEQKKINVYDQLLNVFKTPNDVFNKLSSIDSSLSCLYESVEFIINCQISQEEAEKEEKTKELWRAVINTLIESCDKKLDARNLKTYFICYCLVHGYWQRSEQYIKDDLSILTKSNKMLLHEKLSHLDEQSNKIYLGDEQKQAKETCQKIFEELSTKLPNTLK